MLVDGTHTLQVVMCVVGASERTDDGLIVKQVIIAVLHARLIQVLVGERHRVRSLWQVEVIMILLQLSLLPFVHLKIWAALNLRRQRHHQLSFVR